FGSPKCSLGPFCRRHDRKRHSPRLAPRLIAWSIQSRIFLRRLYSGGTTVDDRSITVIDEGMVGGDLFQKLTGSWRGPILPSPGPATRYSLKGHIPTPRRFTPNQP